MKPLKIFIILLLSLSLTVACGEPAEDKADDDYTHESSDDNNGTDSNNHSGHDHENNGTAANNSASDSGTANNAQDSAGNNSSPTEPTGELVLDDSIFENNGTGAIAIRVTNSNSEHLPNGTYGASHVLNSSSRNSPFFMSSRNTLYNPEEGTLVVSIYHRFRAENTEPVDCADRGDRILIRYPEVSGFTQLISLNCTLTYTYDEENNRFTGTLVATVGDGLQEPDDTKTAEVEGTYSFIPVD